MQDSDRTLGSERTLGTPNDALTLQPDSGEEVPTLPPGTVLASRYQIIQTLGVGGMGAVYKAFDRQLTRVVALKTILPELSSTPLALRRLKQEVLLAQQVVHKNVVRIFDIGEDGATKFITMDFIEGTDLKNQIGQRGKLPAQEAVAIIRQVCQGLETAHGAGVVHRDLKPQNIMVQQDGHALVMDFGIAHSGQSKGMTQTGAFVGTPEYMSPEQARAEEVDARSDIFSLGLIFYEMLTGKLPFHAKTMLEMMYVRTKERAIPPAEIEQSVPKGANEIVVKCLEIDPKDRYHSITEILTDLETFDPSKKVTAVHLKARLRKVSRYRNWAAAAVLVLLALVVGFVVRSRVAPPKGAAEHAPVSVLVADFTNHTGDPVFDGPLEPIVKLALEGAGFVTAYDRNQVRGLGAQAVSGRFDDLAALRVAVERGVNIVVSGSLDLQSGGYSLTIKATQAVTGNTIASAEDAASKKDQVLFAATKLAAAVRKALGDETSESAQRFAMETLTATSLEAVHEYATAMVEQANGRHEDALKSFSKAVDVDPNFGVAYMGMATSARNVGQQQDAENYIKLALKNIDHMTERERYRTRGMYYLVLGNSQKCIDEYANLISHFPADSVAHNNVALCSTWQRNMPKAIDEMRQAVTIFPKRPMFRLNTSVYASYGGDFQTGEREARALLELDPSYPTGGIALAFALLSQGQLPQAAQAYQSLEKLGNLGASRAQSGLADLAIYEGRFGDAAEILEKGAASDIANKYAGQAAAKFAALAYTRLSQNQKKNAVAAAENALKISQSVNVRFLAGRILATAGETARAQALAKELAADILNEPQAYAKLIEGEIALQKGDPRAAIKPFTEGNTLMNTWLGHFGLGRAYLAVKAFTEADSEFDQAIKRRGEALSVFLDETPTYGYFPTVYYYAGRVREGMNVPGFAEFYRTYLSIREKAGEDPLLLEVRKKAGQ